MKFSRIVILFVLTASFKFASAQEITLNRKNITLDRLFEEIKRQTDYDFLYNPRLLEKAKPVNVEAVKAPLRTVLDNCFAGQPLTYTIDQRTIIVKEKPVNRAGNSAITGRVVDKNRKAVGNASVFLSNATLGCQTDTSGDFRLENVKPGKYDLVVSMVGFETYHQAITVAGENISLDNVVLIDKTIGLKEVVVHPHNDNDHSRNLYFFTQEFLGATYLANDCKIINPEVLDFDYDKATGALMASSGDRFLVIDNGSLGYRIRYLLEEFNYDRTGVKYSGSVLFEPMHGSPSQERVWEKRREAVYEASELRFMRSLMNGRAEEDGFQVLAYADAGAGKQALSNTPLSCSEIIRLTDKDDIYAFGNNHKKLYIEYNKNHHFHSNDRPSRLLSPANFEATVVSFLSPYLFFDQNGWVTNPNDVSLLGAWENRRVAGLLPSDYEPAKAATQPGDVVVPDTSGLGRQLMDLKETSDILNAKYAAEKLYIQFDKPYYAAGDTIWLKAYLLNEPTYNLSARSGLLHIDLANDSNKVIKQYLLPVKDGLARGKIGLDEKVFKPGNYVMRVYTQWMRNFGNNAIYYKNITVTGAGNWLVNENISKDKQGIAAQLQFTGMDKTPVANKVLQLQVKVDGKRVYGQNVTTDAEGRLNTAFSLPVKASGVSLIAEDKAGGRKAIIPVSIDREMNIDLQLLPEGGQLVAGFNSRIGFKAVASDGKGIAISGIITDQRQKEVTAFKSLHNGMGSFEFLPEKGASYTAKVTLPDGSVKSCPLPGVKASGTVLQVKNLSGDSLQVNIAATDSLVRAGNSYFLLAKARGVICYGAVVDLRQAKFIHSRLSTHLFPSGIVHFILTTIQGQPLNERLVYVDHHDGLRFDIRPDQQAYSPKDSVALHIKVTDKDGDPVVGNFSMAVTDDAQVKTDSLGNDHIFSRMLLTSDLKGYVEEPGYYFGDNVSAKQALDNLLLTQGWVNYDPPVGKLPFEAETGFKVRGRVNNLFNKGLKKTEMVLLSTRPQIIMDTVTDKDGRFVFDHFPRVDTPVFVLKTANRNFNVNIDVDETPPPMFAPPAIPLALPWYVNADTTLLHFLKNNTHMQQLQYYPGGGRILREVKITAKKLVKDSYNPNGPGEADVVMDEKDLEQAGKKTWAQLCEEKIPGFHEEMFYHKAFHPHYEVFKRYVILIVNGEMMSRAINAFDIVQFLNFHTAEDIKGIEAITSSKYIYRYIREFFASRLIDPETIAFVEITTRSGDFKMPFTPGTYLYKPLAVSWPKQFYKPKYTIKDTTNLTDLRSTVDWEPNISTDKNGEATVWFYAAGTASSYSIILEGVDGNGLLGYKRQKLLIAKPKSVIAK